MKCGYICDLKVNYTSGRKIDFGGVDAGSELGEGERGRL